MSSDDAGIVKRPGAFHRAIASDGGLVVVNLRGASYWLGPERSGYVPILFQHCDGRFFYGRYTARGPLHFRFHPSATLMQLSPEDARRQCELENIDYPAAAVPEDVGVGSKPIAGTKPPRPTTEDDRPDPEMFRAYHAAQAGVRQAAIALELELSQATVSRYIGKVKAWLAAGNKLPGLEEPPGPSPRPRTFPVDPLKIGRYTGDEDE
jgi:hypothetical protein